MTTAISAYDLPLIYTFCDHKFQDEALRTIGQNLWKGFIDVRYASGSERGFGV